MLHRACADRSLVRFRYHDIDREVEPYGLLTREGWWYVVGFDRTREGLRNFRVDRIDGDVETGEPGGFERPAGFDVRAALPDDPYELGGDEVLERLLLRVGADARVVSPPELCNVGRDAARRLLAAYDD